MLDYNCTLKISMHYVWTTCKWLPQESVLANTNELLSQSPPPPICPVLHLGAPCWHHHLPSSHTSPKPVSNPPLGEHVCVHPPPGRDTLLLQDLLCWSSTHLPDRTCSAQLATAAPAMLAVRSLLSTEPDLQFTDTLYGKALHINTIPWTEITVVVYPHNQLAS